MPEPAAMTLPQMRRQQSRQLRQIKSYAQGGNGQINRERLDRAIDGYLNSRLVRAIAIAEVEAVDAENMPSRVSELRAGMDGSIDWRTSLETCCKRIRWNYHPKSNHGVRPICSLPTQLKAWNRIAKDLIAALHSTGPHIADWQGRGRDQQIRQIADVLVHRDLSIVVADVTNAFGSVQPDALYHFLNLPDDLIRGAMDARSFNFVENVEKSRSEVFAKYPLYRLPSDGAIPQGLLQGSPTSNFAFGVLLNDLPDQIPENLGCFVYCDNIVVVADDRRSAQLVENALVEYFTRHPAGPFSLISSIETLSPMGFEHLGYWFRWNHDRLWVGMATNNYGKFIQSLQVREPHRLSGLQYVRSCFSSCSEDALFQYEFEDGEMFHEE